MLTTLTALCGQTMRSAIAEDDDLVAKGLNANRALALIKLFWMRTGIELDVNLFYRARTPRAIVQAIADNRVQPGEKILLLRDGDHARPLFLFAGGVNCFLETQDLVGAMSYDGAIYGITLTDFGRPANDPPAVADEIALAYRAIKDIQPTGPYRIAGYSFGGLLALELARRARAEGDAIAALMLLDPPQNDHSWPLPLWARLMRRTVTRQAKSVLGKLAGRTRRRDRRSGRAPGENDGQSLRDDLAATAFRHSPPRRGHQLVFRFLSPRRPDYPLKAPQWAGGYTPAYDARARQLLQMKGLYRPSLYDGPLVFFGSTSGSPIDCDAPRIWKPYLPQAEWITVSGNHLSMIVARNGKNLAALMDRSLRDAAAPTQVQPDRRPSSGEESAAA
ncbi:thioesterase domain-containing protein [Rhizobium sp. PP-F2F-G48]|uniref:thioesterase domain-containing protein n=1 Tax=Rhizobium sp. PP-F2F-G48 TaxID=2135651 RepID=UPI00105385D0|nr:thioesterase domain-containing protein [Rhizobium sp. PP-F2F-G48]TCM55800.1 thioesterase domain-containing protein [Rhizobium sp. PP-F2F-G48]